MVGVWDKTHNMCSIHGATNRVDGKGVATYRYCPICKIATLKHELETAHEEIGLLKAQVELGAEDETH